MRNPFAPTFEALPSTIPIFPLPQALVLPGSVLPLNIFEPRYLAMISDALGAPGRLIGMIQPDPTGVDDEAIYSVGCTGRITAFQETDDGRYGISLTGVARFRVVEELDTISGYRRVVPDWTPYRSDLEPAVADGIDVGPLTNALRSYSKHQGLNLSWDTVEKLRHVELVNLLSQSLPFSVEEKQLLIESETVASRALLLTSLLEFAAGSAGSAPGQGSPGLH